MILLLEQVKVWFTSRFQVRDEVGYVVQTPKKMI